MWREDRSRSRAYEKQRDRSQSFRVICADRQEVPVYNRTIISSAQHSRSEQTLFPNTVRKYGQQQTELQKLFGNIYDRSVKTGKKVEMNRNHSQLGLEMKQTNEKQQYQQLNRQWNRKNMQTIKETPFMTVNRQVNLAQFKTTSQQNQMNQYKERSSSAQLMWSGNGQFWKEQFAYPEKQKRVLMRRGQKEQIDQKKRHYKKGCLLANNQKQYKTGFWF